MTYTISVYSETTVTEYLNIQANRTGSACYEISGGGGFWLHSISANFNYVPAERLNYGGGFYRKIRGMAEFNISSIPDDSNIVSLDLYYHGTTAGDCHLTMFDIESCSNANTYYNGIAGGTLIVTDTMFPVVGAQQIKDLGSTAIAELTDYLATKTYIGIGLILSNEDVVDNVAMFGMYPSANPKPTLRVGFTVASDTTVMVTLSDPASIEVGVSSETSKTTYRDFSYKARARGKSDDYLVINGVEITNSSNTMQLLRDIRNMDRAVLISGLSDSNLNGYYIIKDFRYNKEQGDVCVYHYSLRLEREL